MTHPEEHILELYVLNAESVADSRPRIETHLDECAGCRSMVMEMSAFYSELDRELKAPADSTAPAPGTSIVKRAPDLSIWEERLARGPWSGWGTPVKRLRHYIRRYPMAAAATTFSFAGLAVIGLLMGYEKFSKDDNPSFALINPANGNFEVFNARNEVLWNRPVPDYLNILMGIQQDEVARFVVTDPENDGRNDVVTTLRLAGEPKLDQPGLYVFDGEGHHRTIPYQRNVTFRGTPYLRPNVIDGGCALLVDSSDRANVEFYVIAKTDRSPTAVLRMNHRYEIIGEYWHQGQVVAMYLVDLDGNGKKELIVCGIDDVDDFADREYPFIAVLDPARIAGLTESSATRGYGFEASEAEIRYVRLPVTEVNRLRKVGAGVARMRDIDDRLIFLWTSRLEGEASHDLDFVFSKRFQPERVISSTQIHQVYEREFAAGRIKHRLDDAYLEYLRTQVRFWDGKDWVAGPARVDQPLAKGGASRAPH